MSSSARSTRSFLAEYGGRGGCSSTPGCSPLSSMRRVRVKQKVEPLPSSLSTQIRPPIISTSFFEMARPRPAPPYCSWSGTPAWTKLSKIVSTISAGMPTPVSVTRKSRLTAWDSGVCTWEARSTATSTWPCCVNLMAFAHQVGEHLAQPAGSPIRRSGMSAAMVWMNRRDLFLAVRMKGAKRKSRTSRRAKRFVFELGPAGLDPGEVQDVVDDGQEVQPGLLDQLEVFPGAHGKVLHEGQFRKAQYAVHGGPDLVAHVGQETRSWPCWPFRPPPWTA